MWKDMKNPFVPDAEIIFMIGSLSFDFAFEFDFGFELGFVLSSRRQPSYLKTHIC
jgi:hypothetical protein